jgi:HK97 family phage prohead protease
MVRRADVLNLIGFFVRKDAPMQPATAHKKKHTNGERVDLTADFNIVEIPELKEDAAPEDAAVYKEIEKGGKVSVQKGLNYGEVTVIVSNATTDRYGESITMEGIDLTQIKRNPVVLWGHQYSQLPIGKIIKLWRSNGNLYATIRLDYDIYDFANIVYQMILRGTINAVSIGGLVKKWSDDYMTIEELEMVEVSVVPVGANPDALVVAKSMGMDERKFQKSYEEFVHKSLVDKFAGLGDDELNQHIESLEAVTAALKSTKDQLAQQPSEAKRHVILVTLKQQAGEADATVGKLNRTIKVTLKKEQ